MILSRTRGNSEIQLNKFKKNKLINSGKIVDNNSAKETIKIKVENLDWIDKTNVDKYTGPELGSVKNFYKEREVLETKNKNKDKLNDNYWNNYGNNNLKDLGNDDVEVVSEVKFKNGNFGKNISDPGDSEMESANNLKNLQNNIIFYGNKGNKLKENDKTKIGVLGTKLKHLIMGLFIRILIILVFVLRVVGDLHENIKTKYWNKDLFNRGFENIKIKYRDKNLFKRVKSKINRLNIGNYKNKEDNCSGNKYGKSCWENKIGFNLIRGLVYKDLKDIYLNKDFINNDNYKEFIDFNYKVDAGNSLGTVDFLTGSASNQVESEALKLTDCELNNFSGININNFFPLIKSIINNG